MPKCKKCDSKFPSSVIIEGKKRNIGARVYCLDCSPFGAHNTRQLDIREPGVTYANCARCGVKAEGDKEAVKETFYIKSDGRPYSYCKVCWNNIRKEKFVSNKSQAVEYLGGSCQICGYSKCHEALEFHHKDPTKKDFGISKYRGVDIERIKPELDKCVLLCANCHRETHAGLHEIS
jgi:hypothetical protein